MRKYFLIVLIFLLMVPNFVFADGDMMVAFFRDGYLWTKINGKEEKITKDVRKYTFSPQWSYDGKWILYQFEKDTNLENEIWVYNLENKKHSRVTNNGANPKWSPIDNIVAFQNGGVLNVSDLKNFYNIALGVDDYNWFPDGKAFISSSSASLLPDGWTNPKLYKITLQQPLDKNTSLTKNVKHFYTIPSNLTKGQVNLLAINARDFSFSPDGKWISFTVSPTASWSMDSDMVCVVTSDGAMFEVIDEIILHLDNPKWAQNKNLLGYISGGGRIVLGFKNKDMKITEMPTFQSTSLTPENFAELGFTWKGDQSLIVSRVKESEWSNDPKKRPNPSLFQINIGEQKQIQITHPPKNFGDYEPLYIASTGKLTWLRKQDIAAMQENLWISDQNGKNARVWIKNIGGYAIYDK